MQGGGPCATALVAARKLGVSAAYMGTIGDDPFGRFMLEDLERWGVRHRTTCAGCPACVSFHAVVLLNQANAQRAPASGIRGHRAPAASEGDRGLGSPEAQPRCCIWTAICLNAAIAAAANCAENTG